MAEFKLETLINIRCPKCSNEALNSIEYLSAGSVLITENDFELDVYLPFEDEDHDKVPMDAIVRWQCTECKYISTLELKQSWPSCHELVKLDEFISVDVVFDEHYFPKQLLIGDIGLPITEIVNYKPSSNSLEVLYSGIPFGMWTLKLKNGSCSVRIERPLQILRDDPLDGMELRIESVNSFARAQILAAAKRVEDLLNLQLARAQSFEEIDRLFDLPMHKPFPYPLAGKLAYTIATNTEVDVRRKIWHLLASKFDSDGSNWWKSILPPDIAEQVLKRLSENTSYIGSNHQVCDFLTTGEISRIVDSRWDILKEKGLKGKYQVLAAFTRFEKFRNSVAHGRSIDPDNFRQLLIASRELLDSISIQITLSK